jgi:hypothetical protein
MSCAPLVSPGALWRRGGSVTPRRFRTIRRICFRVASLVAEPFNNLPPRRHLVARLLMADCVATGFAAGALTTQTGSALFEYPDPSLAVLISVGLAVGVAGLGTLASNMVRGFLIADGLLALGVVLGAFSVLVS